MAIKNITYTDKESLVTSQLPEENIVTDSDMNEIKEVVNNNATELGNAVSITTNENGTAIKFINGIMICIKTISLTNISVSSAVGNLFSSAEINLGNFAESFSANPTVTASLTTNDYNGFLGELKRATNLNSAIGSIYIYRPVSTTTGRYTVNVIAIGTY